MAKRTPRSKKSPVVEAVVVPHVVAKPDADQFVVDSGNPAPEGWNEPEPVEEIVEQVVEFVPPVLDDVVPVARDADGNPLRADGSIDLEAVIAEGKAADGPERVTKVVSGSVIPATVKKAYGKSQSCDDSVAIWLLALLKAGWSLQQIGMANGVSVSSRWGHLNTGMQRMNLGNVLRNLRKLQPLVEPTGEPANKPKAQPVPAVLVQQ